MHGSVGASPPGDPPDYRETSEKTVGDAGPAPLLLYRDKRPPGGLYEKALDTCLTPFSFCINYPRIPFNKRLIFSYNETVHFTTVQLERRVAKVQQFDFLYQNLQN